MSLYYSQDSLVSNEKKEVVEDHKTADITLKRSQVSTITHFHQPILKTK